MATVLDNRFAFAENRDRDIYSQFGEDGLIEAVFEKIGTRNEWCFEVGAADGRYLSNTLRLRENGWRAVLIESDKPVYDKLAKYESTACHTLHADITKHKLDSVMAGFGAPEDMDLGVVDIDGQDYHAWDDMKVYQPRVLMIEVADGCPVSPIPVKGSLGAQQAGRNAMLELGKSKGYVPVLENRINIIFVKGTSLDGTQA